MGRAAVLELVVATWSIMGGHILLAGGADVELTDYHNYTQLTAELDRLVREHPDLAKVYSLGQTVEGRELAVIQISRGVNQERVLLKPMMKLVGNMHGNEAVGRELLLALATLILRDHEQEPRLARILDTTDLHILASLNPDGFENSTKGVCRGYHVGTGRHNGNMVDLNRAFPTWDDVGETRATLVNRSEPEVAAVIGWVLDQPFVLSANFHDGAVVANYPYDDSNLDNGLKSVTPDDATFVSLSRLYAARHRTMSRGSGLCDEDNFPGGITNGAEWYVVEGGMQDFNYLFSNCMEITVELSCCKYPLEATLQGHWEDNREALLAYVEAVQTGLRGVVTEAGSGAAVASANIQVAGIDKNVTTSLRGEYWRLLAPGKYCVRATSPDEVLVTSWVEVAVAGLEGGQHVRVDFTLGGEVGQETNTHCSHLAEEATAMASGHSGAGCGHLSSSLVLVMCLLCLLLLHPAHR